MQEGRAQHALQGPLVIEMECVRRDDRLVGQNCGFELATVEWNRRQREDGWIGKVRTAKILRDRVPIRILAVEEAVGADRHLIQKPEQTEASIQRGRVARDGEVRNGIEVLGEDRKS